MEKRYTGRFHEKLGLRDSRDLFLTFDPDASGSLEILLQEDLEQLDLQIEAGAYSDVRIYMQNESGRDVVCRIRAGLQNDAKIAMGLLDLEPHGFDLDLRADLNQPGADFEVFTGQLCLENAPKKGHMKVAHHTRNTYGNMHNFSVVFDRGDYLMVADGTIEKGCPQSESHQETRVLTMGTHHRAEAIPILYIDENDVKASHALTIGQPDASQLYYLQSRGLDKAQAMGLLSIGYFMPVISLLDSQEDRDRVRQEMERKVGLHGHREEY